MPIDPSIIGNVMVPQAPQMPDVNAMMQTRTRGMENIYKIETARQEQAKAEAAAQAEAQENALVQALLPAYTYGIETGDMAGALDLVPPEMQANVLPYVQALEGKPPEQVRAALIGSLSTSKAGQEALAAMQKAAALGVQQGQLDVSREDLALRRQKQALDARGEGEWKLEPAEGGFFWTNPRTRQVVPAAVTGAGVPAAVTGAGVPAAVPGATTSTEPNVVTPRIPAPGTPAVEAPISTQQPPSEFKPKVKEAKEEDFTEREGKSLNFALRMIDSDNVVNELEKEGVLTTDAMTNAITGVLRALPTVAGGNLAEQIDNALNVVSPTMTPEEQRLARAQLDFVTAVLRSESGAEIKTSEFPSEYRKYFAVEGDENNPKLLADKKRARQNAIDGMKAQAGGRGAKEVERISKSRGAATAAPAAPGETVDGFKFLGEKGQ